MKIDELDRAEEVLGYQFKDRELLRRALRHASCTDNKLDSNERLEFLGDAILGMVICDYLYEQFPHLLEGELTKIKSTVVSRDTCARIARRLGLDVLIELGKGMRNRGEIPRSLAAGGFEAVIGALYLEAGLERARMFILEHLSSRVRAAFRSGHQQNFKSVLQQVAQQKFEAPPSYVLLDEKGPDHAKCFEICVEIGAERFPSSWGPSKKHAEQQAALNALIALEAAILDEDGDVFLLDHRGKRIRDHLPDTPDDGRVTSEAVA